MTNKEMKRRLDKIQRHNGGLLSPAAVVADATPDDSPLHDRFEWDDSKAGHEYRLEQARHIIRAVVAVVSGGNGSEITTRAFVSLSTAHGTDAPYIAIDKALGSRSLMTVLMQDARRDAETFARKYAIVRKLAPVIAVMRKTKLLKQ